MNTTQIKSELTFKAVRSSGSGGQNVNKVSSKVELYFNLQSSIGLNDDEKIKLAKSLKNRISKDGIIILSCDESRSQTRNKAIVIQRFLKLLEEGLLEEKDRIKTKVPRKAVKKRLKQKKIHGEKKANRQKPDLG